MERASARIASSPCKQTFTPAEVFGIQLGNNDATVALEMQQPLPSSVEDRARILFETWRSQLCGSAGRHGHLCFDVLAGKFFESRRVFFFLLHGFVSHAPNGSSNLALLSSRHFYLTLSISTLGFAVATAPLEDAVEPRRRDRVK
jgi:hypothetical protein